MDPSQPQNTPQNPYGPYNPVPGPDQPYPQQPAQPGPYGYPQQPTQTPPPQDQYVDPDQPVAFDQYGNPLYSRPQQPQVVHLSRSIQPMEQEIPEEILQRYEQSKRLFPNLNLSRGEYVISAVKRHPIGLVKIWSIALLLILAFMGLLLGFFMNQGVGNSGLLGDSTLFSTIGVALLIGMTLITVLGGFVATYVYNSNHFYLTNESVIQEIQTSLFSKHEQTVSLTNIEDASYKQDGIIQSFFNYGSIRLSTEGDETTYHFTYVANPKAHIATLNNAVEAFKNGRPVD